MVAEGMWESDMASSSFGLSCRREHTRLHSAHPDEAREMGGHPLHETQPVSRFAEPPWPAPSAPWRQIDAQLQPKHLAREMRQAMPRLALPPLSNSYASRGQTPHRPDLML